MARQAIAERLNNSCSVHELTQNNFLTEFDIAKDWQCEILQFPKPLIADIARITPQAVEHWRRGDRAPNSASMLNIATRLTSVRKWLVARSGHSRADDDPMTFDEILMELHRVAATNTSDGEVARHMIATANSIRPPQLIPPIVQDAWKLIDKREDRAVEIESQKGGRVE